MYPDTEISALCRFIIEHVTGNPFSNFLVDKSKKLTGNEQDEIKKIIDRLIKNEPLQYILGETEFYGLRYVVNTNVLIPRPETEELVDLIINENKNTHKTILDVGTGSGCIAISLKKNLPECEVNAWDISPKAIETATLNSKTNNTDIKFKLVDILEYQPQSEKFDIIVSNPPYVLEDEKKSMDKNVLDYEPHSALFVPNNDPLLFYRKIAEFAKKTLNTNGLLYFEINSAKGQETVDLITELGFSDTVLIKDIEGKNRIIKAKIDKQL